MFHDFSMDYLRFTTHKSAGVSYTSTTTPKHLQPPVGAGEERQQSLRGCSFLFALGWKFQITESCFAIPLI